MKFDVRFEGRRIVTLKAGKIELEMWEEHDAPRSKASYGVHHLAIYEPTRGIPEAIVEGPDGLRVQFVEQNVRLLI